MIDYTIAREKGGAIAWTDEQVAYIIDKYTNEGYSLSQLGREFNVAYATIKLLLKKHHYFTSGYKRGYPRNEFYFNRIDTPEKAYWLGFWCADGCIESSRYAIKIDSIDKEHLEKFQKAIGAVNHKIGMTIDERLGSNPVIYHFSIRDKQLWADLNKWGCIPNKSLKLTTFPNIPYHFLSHFLRGYFDGNGSLHWLKSTNNYRISFAGTEDFLSEIRKFLNKPNIKVAKQKDRNICQFQISGRYQVEEVLNLLYQDSTPATRLERKYQSYLKCLEWAHRH